MPDLPRVGVPAAELQRLFNTGHYYERMQAGEFLAEIEAGKAHLISLGGETVMSEMWLYKNRAGQVVAIVHQYRRYEGSIAASGLPDPKFLVHEGTVYYLKKK